MYWVTNVWYMRTAALSNCISLQQTRAPVTYTRLISNLFNLPVEGSAFKRERVTSMTLGSQLRSHASDTHLLAHMKEVTYVKKKSFLFHISTMLLQHCKPRVLLLAQLRVQQASVCMMFHVVCLAAAYVTLKMHRVHTKLRVTKEYRFTIQSKCVCMAAIVINNYFRRSLETGVHGLKHRSW